MFATRTERRARASLVALVAALSACASCADGPSAKGAGGGGTSGAVNPTPDGGGAPDVSNGSKPTATADGVPIYGYRVVAEYPHDPNAFTQGLLWHDGFLYESTGQVGESSVRRVALETGEVLQVTPVGQQMFCEGLALVGDRLVQLTWQNHVGFVWDVETLGYASSFTLEGEGWGLTYDGERLLKSDGTTSRLWFLDPATYRTTGSVPVTDGGRPVFKLNELEYVDGFVLANVWETDRIAKIDPATGKVVAWIDLTGIIDVPPSPPPPSRPGNVLNGIAWDPVGRRLFVTGKDWPTLFEIELVAPEDR
ncbi:MAG: glutaminyl-peptide cyclotransferase [Planctomycetota bacterium]